ncbi:MAG: hypothetical protein J4F42_14325 [Desulfurellaceae bacterium]|nr:hypothetical protein [Desulfurellaceae bacterium]
MGLILFGLAGWARAADGPSQALPGLVEEKGRVLVSGRIFPRRFNAAQGPQARYHFLVWHNGTSPHALIQTPVDDLDFHAALLRLGAQAGKSLPMAAWTERHTHPASHRTLTGSRLAIRVSWQDNPAGLPLERVFKAAALSPRFGGNRDRWFNRIPFAPRPGCLVCLRRPEHCRLRRPTDALCGRYRAAAARWHTGRGQFQARSLSYAGYSPASCRHHSGPQRRALPAAGAGRPAA